MGNKPITFICQVAILFDWLSASECGWLLTVREPIANTTKIRDAHAMGNKPITSIRQITALIDRLPASEIDWLISDFCLQIEKKPIASCININVGIAHALGKNPSLLSVC